MAYKQHFIEWFSGKQIPSYWETEGTVGMVDEVDGGFKITNNGSTKGKLAFDTSTNNVGATFAHTGCKMISVSKLNQTGNGFYLFHGMCRDIYSTDAFGLALPANNSVFKFYSYQGTSAGTEVASTVSTDTNFHKFELETDGTTMTMKIDGATATTSTSNPPANSMFPFYYIQQDGSSTNSITTRYLECYNT